MTKNLPYDGMQLPILRIFQKYELPPAYMALKQYVFYQHEVQLQWQLDQYMVCLLSLIPALQLGRLKLADDTDGKQKGVK